MSVGYLHYQRLCAVQFHIIHCLLTHIDELFRHKYNADVFIGLCFFQCIGNLGCVLAACLRHIGTTAAATAYVTPFRYQAEGKKQPVRPCLTNALPNRAGGLTVLCDMGANPDVEVDDMVRFAQMGSAYARVVLGIEHPRVGLLANGTEDEKGSNFTKACFPAMKAAVPGFVGNCEGTDLTSGNFDVVVADGMSGNIALKATEGAAKFLLQELKGAFMASLGTKIAALLIKKQMREIKAKLSGDAKGGAILLGLRGVVLIGHGATSVEAVKNGTLAAAEAVRAGLVENVANSMDGIVL